MGVYSLVRLATVFSVGAGIIVGGSAPAIADCEPQVSCARDGINQAASVKTVPNRCAGVVV